MNLAGEKKDMENPVILDFETVDSRGASFETFRKDFRVLSVSTAQRDVSGQIKQRFSTDPLTINQILMDLHFRQVPVIAHNLPYEQQVVSSCYPRLKLNWYADTMRLAQMRDGGGDEFQPPELSFEQQMSLELGEISEKEAKKLQHKGIGLSLEACALRFLPDASMHNHKKVAHDWLQEHHKIKKGFGRHLHLLPEDMLKQYNDADTLVTLHLYEELISWMTENKVDWERDHQLYLMRAGLINGAYAVGVKIDREALESYICEVEDEVEAIEARFLEQFRADITELKRRRFNRVRDVYCADPDLKSDRARSNRKAKLEAGELDHLWSEFNIGSSLQLKELFCDVLGMEAKFLTPKGSPSFKSSHLGQWGTGGEILLKRRKRLIVLVQCINVYLASSYDGRVHCSVRSAGTRSNRVAGGRL